MVSCCCFHNTPPITTTVSATAPAIMPLVFVDNLIFPLLDISVLPFCTIFVRQVYDVFKNLSRISWISLIKQPLHHVNDNSIIMVFQAVLAYTFVILKRGRDKKSCPLTLLHSLIH